MYLPAELIGNFKVKTPLSDERKGSIEDA